MARPRYRFGEFTASPGRRLLLRSGREVPLIPRYFDLLLLLIEQRHEAVARQEIFDQVWSDVVVSDGALSQAVRTLRRALGDDPRRSVFIRTVSRHGYRFVHADVLEEPDEAPLPALAATPGAARALLRDMRWDVPGAGPVPLLGQPGALAAIRSLIGLRLRRAARLAGSRWAAASGGGALAGVAAALLGGIVLYLAPGSAAPVNVAVALATVGAVVGGLGAAGVGAGLAVAEALARSLRGLALVVCGALGGGAIGAVAHLAGRWTFLDVFGRDLSAVGGGFEGILIGAAAGLGYALSTPRPGGGGMATPRGWERLSAAVVTGACCAVAGVALSLSGRNLGGGSLDIMARSFQGSQVGLAPIARLLGEPEVGPVTRAVLSGYEGLLFGFGLTLGLTRRPREARAAARG